MNLIFLFFLAGTGTAYASSVYQYKMLFTPSVSVLHAEAKGRVNIYSHFNGETVDQAMNEQFNRIENMMFIKTVQIDDHGQYRVGSDSCD